MYSVVPSIYDYKLETERLAQLGRSMITYSHMLWSLERVCVSLGRVEEDESQGKINQLIMFLTDQVKNGQCLEMKKLLKELKWALDKIQFARNMVAHGTLLYDVDGSISFWSHEKRKELPLGTILGLEPCFNYALWVAVFMEWTLARIPPHKPLPPRPYLSKR